MMVSEKEKHYWELLAQHRKAYEEAIRPIIKALVELAAIQPPKPFYLPMNEKDADGILDELRNRGLAPQLSDGLRDPALDVEVR